MAQNLKKKTGGAAHPRSASSSRGTSSSRSASSRSASSRSTSSSHGASSRSSSSSRSASSSRSTSSQRRLPPRSGGRTVSGSSGSAAIDRRRPAEGEGALYRASVSIRDFLKDCVDIARDKSLGFDLPLLILILTLVAIGLTMLYSASYAYAYYHYGSSFYFIKSQLIFAAVGIVVMILVSLVPAEKLSKFVLPLMVVTVILLVIVRLLPPGKGGVYRWIKIGDKISIQPSEIAKLALIMEGAKWGSNYYDYKRRHPWKGIKNSFRSKKSFADRLHGFWSGLGRYIFVSMLIAGLVLVEKHVSCTVILILLAGTMFLVAGVDWKIIAGVLGTAGAGVLFVVLTGKIAYAQERINVWRDPFAQIDDGGWQNVQAIYAISSGGVLGQGIGNSKQKFLYLPEPQNDFIFAVVCEELGFIGATAVILLFAAFVWRGFVMSVSNSDRFSKLLGIGITAQIGWQTLLNVAVVTNTIPNTGISLPFFSAGGTSLMMLLFEMGILLSVSRKSTEKQMI